MTPRKLGGVVSRGDKGNARRLDVPALFVDGRHKEHAPPEDLHRNKRRDASKMKLQAGVVLPLRPVEIMKRHMCVTFV